MEEDILPQQPPTVRKEHLFFYGKMLENQELYLLPKELHFHISRESTQKCEGTEMTTKFKRTDREQIGYRRPSKELGGQEAVFRVKLTV